VAFRDRRVVTGIVHVIRNGLRWRWQRGMPVKARAAAYPAIRNTIFRDFLRSLVRTVSIRVARRICLVSISAVSGRSTA
jgi:hypothetical protein